MSDHYRANIDGNDTQIYLRKNVVPAKGKRLVFRKIHIGSAWVKGDVIDISADGRIIMNTSRV